MSRRARLWAAAAASVALVIGLLLSTGVVRNTFSLWEAEATNSGSVFAGGWLPPATSPLAPSVTGASNNQISLSWTSGFSAAEPNPNPVTGQQLQIADGGNSGSSACPATGSGSFTDEGTALAKNQTMPVTDSPSVPIAHWLCYEVVSTLTGTSWRSVATPFPAIRLLVPTAIAFNHTGAADGHIESGETITITFNQNVAKPSINLGICEVKGTSDNGFLILGYSGTCAAGASYAIGQISGINITKNSSATASVSASGNTITITATAGDVMSQGITTEGTFVASTSVTASGGSPAACTGAGCTPGPSGGF